jgi:hypothetical protein
VRQARLGLGGDKLDAPTDQLHSATVVPGSRTQKEAPRKWGLTRSLTCVLYWRKRELRLGGNSTCAALFRQG